MCVSRFTVYKSTYVHQVKWLNEYNEKIRKEVGTELLKNNKTTLGYDWMMARTHPVSSNGRQNEGCLVVVSTILLVTGATFTNSPTIV